MNASERKEHGALGQHFAYVPDGGTKAYEGKEDLIDALQTGILSRKIVRFSYKDSRGRARSGDLAPFVILMYRQGLYVVGARVGEGYASADLHDWRKGLGVFAVERFVEAEHLRKRTFEIPVDFQIDEVLHGAFGVHVGDPANARELSSSSRPRRRAVAGRVWHPTQKLTRAAGGRMRLTFTCTNLMPVVSDSSVGTAREGHRAAGVRPRWSSTSWSVLATSTRSKGVPKKRGATRRESAGTRLSETCGSEA